MHPVKTSSALNPTEVIASFQGEGPRYGFQVEAFGEIDEYPLLAMSRRTRGVRPRFYLSAGIHGDEPAGPLALLKLLREGFFDEQATWFLCPVLNPVGLQRLTRENGSGIDLNRDYREPICSREIPQHVKWLQCQPNFDLAVCVHEDWESVGFYLYEVNFHGREGAAEAIVRAVQPGCAIDPAEMIDGRAAKGGIIRPAREELLARDRWAEALYLHAHHAQLIYTIETPSAFPIDVRVDAHCAAIRCAVGAATSEFWRRQSSRE